MWVVKYTKVAVNGLSTLDGGYGMVMSYIIKYLISEMCYSDDYHVCVTFLMYK
jgi:hypothetical protein